MPAGDSADNRDGSVVAYLQVAHNERHPATGSPVAKVIHHNFGRAEKVDRDAGPAGVLDVTVPDPGAGGHGGARRRG